MDSAFTELKVDTRTLNYHYGSITQYISVGEHLWELQCQPRCSNRDSVSLFLQTTSTSHGVNAIFVTFVVGTKDRNGASSPFCASVSPCDWTHFIRRSDLELVQSPHGVATITCGVILTGDRARTTSVPPPMIPLPPASDVGHQLESLQQSGEGSDVSFVVGGETFPVHRAVLAARLPVFKVELLGSMADAKMPRVVLDGIDPVVFRALLKFAYTDALPEDEDLEGYPLDVLQHVLAAADRYAMDRLKIVCAQKLCDKLSADTVMGVLACAETYNCPELKERCMDFIVKDQNFKKVTLRENYMRFWQRFPSIIAELRKRAGM